MAISALDRLESTLERRKRPALSPLDALEESLKPRRPAPAARVAKPAPARPPGFVGGGWPGGGGGAPKRPEMLSDLWKKALPEPYYPPEMGEEIEAAGGFPPLASFVQPKRYPTPYPQRAPKPLETLAQYWKETVAAAQSRLARRRGGPPTAFEQMMERWGMAPAGQAPRSVQMALGSEGFQEKAREEATAAGGPLRRFGESFAVQLANPFGIRGTEEIEQRRQGYVPPGGALGWLGGEMGGIAPYMFLGGPWAATARVPGMLAKRVVARRIGPEAADLMAKAAAERVQQTLPGRLLAPPLKALFPGAVFSVPQNVLGQLGTTGTVNPLDVLKGMFGSGVGAAAITALLHAPGEIGRTAVARIQRPRAVVPAAREWVAPARWAKPPVEEVPEIPAAPVAAPEAAVGAPEIEKVGLPPSPAPVAAPAKAEGLKPPIVAGEGARHPESAVLAAGQGKDFRAWWDGATPEDRSAFARQTLSPGYWPKRVASRWRGRRSGEMSIETAAPLIRAYEALRPAPVTPGVAEAAVPAAAPAAAETANLEAAGPLPPRQPIPLLSQGPETTVQTEPGTTAPVRYAIVEAGDITASHDLDLRPNPNHPAGLQQRGREAKALHEQVVRIARNPDAQRAGESPLATEGAPILDETGNVVAGNGRAIGIARAYRDFPESAEVYRNGIEAQAEKLGLSGEAIRSAREPVLVRVGTWPSQAEKLRFARDSDVPTTAARRPSEIASSDAERMDMPMLAKFVPNEQGNIGTLANQDFARDFLRRAVPSPGERNALLQPDGTLSQAGIERIRHALFQKAYGDPHLSAALAEATEETALNPLKAALQAAPRFAQIRERMATGQLHDVDISREVGQALRRYREIRSRGQLVEEALSQRGLGIGEGEAAPPLEADLMRFFDRNKRSARRILDAFNLYMDAVEKRGSPRQAGLGVAAEAEPLTAEGLFRRVVGVVEKAGEPVETPAVLPGMMEGGHVERAGTRRVVPAAQGARGVGAEVAPAGAAAPERVPAGAEGARGVEAEVIPSGPPAPRVAVPAARGRPVVPAARARRPAAAVEAPTPEVATQAAASALAGIRAPGGPAKGAAPGAQDILREIAEVTGAPVRFGRVRQPTRAIFKRRAEVIRLKQAGDVASALHEAGEAVDKATGLSREADLLEHLGGAETTETQRAEAASNAVRSWLLDPAAARQQSPEVSAALERLAAAIPSRRGGERNLLGDLQALAEMVGRYRRAAPVEAFKAEILSPRRAEELAKPRPLVRGAAKITGPVWDDLVQMREAVKEIERAAGRPIPASRDPYTSLRLISTRAQGMMKQAVEFGWRDKYGEKLTPSFNEVVATAKKGGSHDDFVAYLAARRAKSLADRGKPPATWEPEIVEGTLLALDRPEFRQAADQWREFVGGWRKWLEEVGAVEEGWAAKMAQTEPDWVPFQTFFPERGGGRGTGGGALIRRIGISGRPRLDPLLEAQKILQVQLQVYPRLKAWAEAVHEAERAGGLGRLAERVPPKVYATKVGEEIGRRLTRRMTQIMEGKEIEVPETLAEDMMKLISDTKIWQPAMRGAAAENVIPIFERGKVTGLFQIHPELYALYTRPSAVGPEWLKMVFSLFRPFTKLVRVTSTVLRPIFHLRNLARDNVLAFIQTPGWTGHVGSLREAFAGLAKASPEYQVALRAGAFQTGRPAVEMEPGGLADAMMEAIKRTPDAASWADIVFSPRRWGRAIAGPLAAIGEKGENLTRFAVFLSTLKRKLASGLTYDDAVVEAAMQARESTVPFERGGSASKAVNQVKAFFNAQMQGSYTAWRMLRGNSVQTIGKALAVITLPKVAEYLWYRDDKDWQALPMYRKLGFYNLYVGRDQKGERKFLPIPMSWEWGLVFGAAAIVALEELRDKDTPAWQALKEAARTSLSPVDDPGAGLAPDIFAPLVELWANRDYLGRPIVPGGLEKASWRVQFTPSTPEVAREIGRVTGLSPVKIAYTLRSYFGGLGSDLMAGIDDLAAGKGLKPPASGLDILRGIVTKASYSSEYQNRFYQEIERLERAESEWEAGVAKPTSGEEARLAFLRAAQRTASELRGKAREVMLSREMPAEEKERVLDDVAAAQMKLFAGALGKPIPEWAEKRESPLPLRLRGIRGIRRIGMPGLARALR